MSPPTGDAEDARRLHEGYGHPRGDYIPGASRPTIPPMPVAWTPEIVRSMLPIRFGLGRQVALAKRPTGPVLILVQAGAKEFPATPQGWVDLWTTVASTVKPARLQAGLTTVTWAKAQAVATPFRNAEATLDAETRAHLVLGGLVFLGGHGYDDGLPTGAVVDLRMVADGIVLTNVSDGSVAWSVAGRQLLEIEASGPGAVTSGGFTATVGHGLVGDLGDRFAAQWMTDRFGKTTIVTFVRIETDSSELFLRSMTDAPGEAQVALSPLRALARQGRAPGTPGAGAASTADAGSGGPTPLTAPLATGPIGGDSADDLVSHLERLARLRDSGALSESEYQLAKTKLLG